MSDIVERLADALTYERIIADDTTARLPKQPLDVTETLEVAKDEIERFQRKVESLEKTLQIKDEQVEELDIDRAALLARIEELQETLGGVANDYAHYKVEADRLRAQIGAAGMSKARRVKLYHFVDNTGEHITGCGQFQEQTDGGTHWLVTNEEYQELTANLAKIREQVMEWYQEHFAEHPVEIRALRIALGGVECPTCKGKGKYYDEQEGWYPCGPCDASGVKREG